MGNKKYAYVNNELLIWARSKTPFETTLDVESKIKISASKIDSWEKGEDLPSITEAKKLAKLYKVPFASFFLSEPPLNEPKQYVDRRTNINTIYHNISYELWSEIEHINANRNKIMDYTDEYDYYDSLPTFDKNDSIKFIADTIREFLGLKLPYKNKSAYNNGAYNFYKNIFEAHGIIVMNVKDVELEEMKGISIYYDKFPIIIINKMDYDRAKAFSLMHELAHLVRRSSSLCLIDFDERNDDEEKLCDKIAAEILMPEKEFNEISNKMIMEYGGWSKLCLDVISDKFAVSSTSVVMRLYELKKISKNEYVRIYKMLENDFALNKEIIDNKNKEKEVVLPYDKRFLNKEGRLFTRMIISAYYKGNISYGEMCHILNISSKYIYKLEQAVMLR
jgi:Zn-dependent peptidase ImmA (M78 family)/DNA-binding XRE family transcriptional regulator